MAWTAGMDARRRQVRVNGVALGIAAGRVGLKMDVMENLEFTKVIMHVLMHQVNC